MDKQDREMEVQLTIMKSMYLKVFTIYYQSPGGGLLNMKWNSIEKAVHIFGVFLTYINILKIK